MQLKDKIKQLYEEIVIALRLETCGSDIFGGTKIPNLFLEKYPDYYIFDRYSINFPTLAEVIEFVEEQSKIIFQFDDYWDNEYTFINSKDVVDFIYSSYDLENEGTDKEKKIRKEISIFSLDESNATETFRDMYEIAYSSICFCYKGNKYQERPILGERLSHKQLFDKMCADLDGYLELFKEHNNLIT